MKVVGNYLITALATGRGRDHLCLVIFVEITFSFSVVWGFLQCALEKI